MILGYLMYRSGLVPRGMAMLGLIGGPLIVASGIAIMFEVIERGPRCRASRRFIWELSFGIYRSGRADEAGVGRRVVER
jgi:hypothetical protein